MTPRSSASLSLLSGSSLLEEFESGGVTPFCWWKWRRDGEPEIEVAPARSMVAAIPPATAAASRRDPSNRKNPSPPRHRNDPQNPRRPPLVPSEKDNAVSVTDATAGGPAPRRPRSREISSRYLSSSSSSSSTSTSYSTATTLSSSGSSSGSRRFPSPLVTPRPSTPPTLSQSAAQKRSHSVDRVRPLTPRPDPCPASAEPSAAARALCTMTRSLSVSFQGESFFYQTSHAKTASPSPARKPSPERRRVSAVAATPARAGDHSENKRPSDNHRLWPGARHRASNPLMRSLDCSLGQNDSILATVRLMQQSLVFDDGTRRASFDGADLSASSDTDSMSSGSNSAVPELRMAPRSKVAPRGISVPARFWQENNSRLRQLPDSGSLPSSSGSSPMVHRQQGLVKKLPVDCPSPSPRLAPSPLRGPIRPSSPDKHMASPSRGMVSPLRARSGRTPTSSPVSQPANAPSIISFAAEVRRAKKGENRIEEAHLLRLFDNQHLQWRFVNARASAASLWHKVTAEKHIYNVWAATSKLRDSVTFKRTKLRLLTQNLKLKSVLHEQMTYLEEWSLMHSNHSSSLSGAIDALNATTLRLPVVGGVKADIQEMKYAVGSAVEVMQAMGSSIFFLLSKVEGTSSVISEITKVAAEERLLLEKSRDLLSTVAAMHVTQCSLQSHVIQLKQKASPT
ncbi:QWRF motif-containing protein 2-like isoform X1 [Musa acuminata AAA Group]|uniref:QWRF motif-containing protein 2-like isoform X1 n=2 Tax=Musa acuminata AAA Group TaxID=214697 RepID=UPI0031D1ED56